MSIRLDSVCCAPAQGLTLAATNSTCRCSPAITSPMMTARALSTPRPATVRTTTSLSWAAFGTQAEIPHTVDEFGAFTEEAPGFEGKKVLVLEGKKAGEDGDANKAVIDALIEQRRAARARAAETFLSAFVALEGAGHFPQHAAMVHRPRQEEAGRPHLARGCARRDRRDDFHAGGRQESPARHDRRAARTGSSRASAPGACRSRSSSTRKTGEILNDADVNTAHRRRGEGEGRRRLVRDVRRRCSSARRAPTTSTRRSRTFSTSGSIQARRTPSRSKAARI